MPSPPVNATARQWGGVLAMSLGAFALVAAEFMPVSLLTPLARDLHVSEGQAGQAIAVSGAFALVTSLIIAPLAGGVDRKRLLLALTVTMMLSATLAALAPDFTTFMVGRALIGIAIGGFWSMSAATAMRLIPPHQVPRALALVNGGNALAMVVAAPLGSYFGAVVGWRGAFFLLVPVAFAALLWKMATLPRMQATGAPASWNVLGLLRHRVVALGMLATCLFFMGQFALFTYLRPYLETVGGITVSTLSLILLMIGGAGVIGTVLIEPFVKNWLYATLIVLPLLMAALALALALADPALPLTAILLGLWGLFGTSAPVAWWTWLARTLPRDGEAAGGLMVAVVQMAIALGATLGGVLFDGLGYRATFIASAGVLMASMWVAVLARHASHRGAALAT
ncbi:MFS transporter [Stenotrophomonas sp. PS02301]|uniref:MFS transporter n=1 Tax=Stenotrophomonas sp. PS02301 TaxID=2991427 RepID=UPI00249CBF02|nr:MFS transporter [Stenotrophomonas sp. PS02301]